MLIEILSKALKQNKGNAEISGLLKEIRSRGCKRHYVIEKVEKQLITAASQVRRLMGDSWPADEYRPAHDGPLKSR